MPVQRRLFVTAVVLALVLSSFSLPALASDAHITVIQTTDLHDHANGSDHVGLDVNPFSGTGTTGAYSRIATYVNYVRLTVGHPVVLVDSGDWTMGTIYDLTLGSRPLALGFLQLMHYDCVTLGNHEFDYTAKGLAQILSAAQSSFGFNTPIVASNMDLNGDADLAPFVGSGKLIQTARVETLRNGIKVGYIGLMGTGAAQVTASAPVTFTDLSADYAAIQALVSDLRQNQGVQVVIALSHSGTNAAGTAGEDVELAKHVIGINVIASGHTHTPLNAYHTVTNTGWSTQIIDAGAYGTNVSRLDLTYHSSTGSTTVDSFINLPMTNAALTAVNRWLIPDLLQTLIVRAVDQQLNGSLGPFFSQAFPDYDPSRIGTGIYHPVGTTSQLMVSNDDPSRVPPPNGLGDLVADAFRTVPNGIIAQTLAAVGGNPANLPSYDFTPVQAAVMPSGFIRSKLLNGVPLSFADVYDVLPLGISPDPTQALPVGYPLVSAYMELADLKKVCALQLVVQTNLANPEFYVNLSGLQYTLDP
ncbi:MAG TPA: metallophosphoesterase, partial [Steroidobacteraceae bacterium]